MCDFDLISSNGEALENNGNSADSYQNNNSDTSKELPPAPRNGVEGADVGKLANAQEPVPKHESLQEVIDRKRKEKGLPPVPRIPNREGEIEEGHTLLHSGLARYVFLRPDNVVVKLGSYLNLDEVDAMNFARSVGIPIPEVLGWGEQRNAEGHYQHYIEMEYVEGATLEKAWPDLSDETRLDIAHQLREILRKMRAIPPPENYIGSYNSDRIVDARGMSTFVRPACKKEEEFNAFLTAEKGMAKSVKEAYRNSIGKHRIVFTHSDIAPRNIMVRDDRIVAIIDWEGAGWYPEYWEYVKLMHFLDRCPGWKGLVDEIFPKSYAFELLLYTGLRCYQDNWDNDPYESKKGRNQQLPKRAPPGRALQAR
ncbi:hypothetical protein ACQRIT_002196 [Beauveria bassiana]